MAFNVDIRQLTESAFGLKSFPDIPEYDLSKMNFNSTGVDQLGRPYFMDVEFKSQLLNQSFRLPNEPLVTVSKQKSLVKTTIAGNQKNTGGVVVEQVNNGNWSIVFRGIILNEEFTSPQYPQDNVKKLLQYADSAEPLEVNCDYLEVLFGISKIVIENIDLDPMQGKPFSQKYTLSAFSYEDFYAERSKLLN